MNTQTITVETHQAGQLRPYGDSYYEATLTFSWTPAVGVVKKIAAAVLQYGDTIAEKGKQENWAQSYWDFVRPEGEGRWRVRIVQPSTE